jgi:repressor LexA
MNRIKEVLKSKGIKQTWLAERLEKSYNMVNSYVKNRRQPSLEDLFKIAKILDVAVAELLENNISKKTYDSKQSVIFEVSESDEEYEKMVSIPVLGNVACGFPLFAQQNLLEKIIIILFYELQVILWTKLI